MRGIRFYRPWPIPFFILLVISNLSASSDIRSLKTIINFQIEELDTNNDHKTDTWINYSKNKSIKKISYDRNFDQKKDEWFEISKGFQIRQRDTNYDGIIDYKSTFHSLENGKRFSKKIEIKIKDKWILKETRFYDPKNKLIKKTLFNKEGKKLESYHPLYSAQTSDPINYVKNLFDLDKNNSLFESAPYEEVYRQDYETCLHQSSSDSETCSRSIMAERAFFLEQFKGNGDLLKLSSSSCESDDVFYSGTGLIIDKSCKERSIPYDEIEKNFYHGIDGLLQCFGNKAPQRELKVNHFPHEALRSAVYDTYLETIAQGGFKLECHDENERDAAASACYDCKPPRISYYTKAGYSQSVQAHEFIHLTKVLDDRSIDNSHTYAETPQDAHNHGDGWRTGDRVYNCTALCFQSAHLRKNKKSEESFDGLITQEICQTCLSYPNDIENSELYPHCKKFPKQDDLDTLKNLEKLSLDTIHKCEKEHKLKDLHSIRQLSTFASSIRYVSDKSLANDIKDYLSCSDISNTTFFKTYSKLGILNGIQKNIHYTIPEKDKNFLYRYIKSKTLKSCIDIMESNFNVRTFNRHYQSEVLEQRIKGDLLHITGFNHCGVFLQSEQENCYYDLKNKPGEKYDVLDNAFRCSKEVTEKSVAGLEKYLTWLEKIPDQHQIKKSMIQNIKKNKVPQIKAKHLCFSLQKYCEEKYVNKYYDAVFAKKIIAGIQENKDIFSDNGSRCIYLKPEHITDDGLTPDNLCNIYEKFF